MSTLTRRITSLLASLAVAGFAFGCEGQQAEREGATADQQEQEQAQPIEEEQGFVEQETEDELGAEGEQDELAQQDQQPQPTQLDQQEQPAGQQMQPAQQLEYYSQWSKNEQAGQVMHHYASTGFVILSNALEGVSQQVEQSATGGGPTDEPTQPEQQDEMGEMGEQGEMGEMGEMGEQGEMGEMGQQGEMGEMGQQDEMGEQQAQFDAQQVQQHTQQLEQAAQHLGQNQNVYDHPKQFKQGVDSTVSILNSFAQHQQFSEFSDQVQRIDDMSQDIDENQPLAAQKQSVQSFFEHTSNVVDQMAQKMEEGAIGGGPADQQDQQPMQEEQDRLQQEGQELQREGQELQQEGEQELEQLEDELDQQDQPTQDY